MTANYTPSTGAGNVNPFQAPEDDFEDWSDTDELEESFRVCDTVGNFECSFKGVKVNFPYEPYQSQLDMMDNIMAGLQTGTNCLLESPTGTGKTAALLCSLLAWQKERFFKQSSLPPCTCGFDIPGCVISRSTIISKNPDTKVVTLHRGAMVTPTSPVPCPSQNPSQFHPGICSNGNGTPCCSKKMAIEIPPLTITIPPSGLGQLCEACQRKHVTTDGGGEELPTIYYTTRTHSQVAQVVKQLKQTAYADTPMTILSSRNLSCINDHVKRDAHVVPIDDECHVRRQNFYRRKAKSRLQKEEGNDPHTPVCKFYAAREILQPAYSDEFGSTPFDIEDLVKFGDRVGLCPFYGSKLLAPTARIVFCPYNYLLYPWIRDASKIEIKNNIIVFDEAHNIEKICREVATLEIEEQALDSRILKEIETTSEKLRDATRFEDEGNRRRLEKMMNDYYVAFYRLKAWMVTKGERIPIGPKQTEVYAKLELEELMEKFEEFGFGKSSMAAHSENLNFMRDPETSPRIPGRIVSFINRLRYTVSLLYEQENHLAARDFSGVMTKGHRKGSGGKLFSITFKLLCNNPALEFRKFGSARTIIVASGTLSPTVSFASELGVPFPNRLSARHVIKKEQIWVGCLANSGKPFVPLALNKKNQMDPAVQDFIGEQIFQICKIVSFGVVVFLPSYTLRDGLTNRWGTHPQSAPLLPRLSGLKSLYYEVSGQNPQEFKDLMADYKRKVTDGKGCLLLAIFRGKVSEGVDFKDNEARCVVSVGIPYMPIHSAEVVEKKAYNTGRNDTDPTYLSGNAWYACQAFRALNQGLGRCIRHKDDWGALVLLDSRFSQSQNSSKLSVWVAEFLKSYSTQGGFEKSLEDFMKERANQGGN